MRTYTTTRTTARTTARTHHLALRRIPDPKANRRLLKGANKQPTVLGSLGNLRQITTLRITPPTSYRMLEDIVIQGNRLSAFGRHE